MEECSKGIEKEIVDRSVAFGKSIALAIYNWSLTDSGYESYKKNLDNSYVFTRGDS